MYVCVSGGNKFLFFGKIYGAFFSCYVHFEICLFTLLPATEQDNRDNHKQSEFVFISSKVLVYLLGWCLII